MVEKSEMGKGKIELIIDNNRFSALSKTFLIIESSITLCKKSQCYF
jgi:hypothetical protein